MLDGEFFGVNAVSANVLERRQAPIHCALEGRSARNASTNLVAQAAKIGFERRRLERFRNQAIREFFIRIKIGGRSKHTKSRKIQEKVFYPSESMNHSESIRNEFGGKRKSTSKSHTQCPTCGRCPKTKPSTAPSPTSLTP